MSETPALLGLPWEYLFDGNNFLAQAEDTPIVRHFNALKRRPKALKLPLRILVMMADVDADRPLNVEDEKINSCRALSSVMLLRDAFPSA